MSIRVTPILVSEPKSLQDVRQILSQKLQELQQSFAAAPPPTDFLGSRITNIGTPQQPGDAVSLGYLLGVIPSVPPIGTNSLAGLSWNGSALVINGGAVVQGTTTTTGLTVSGTAHIGTMTVTGLGVFGTLSATGPFGANGATPQAPAVSGGAIALTPTNITPYGFASAADFNAMQSLINTIQAALVADGIMS